MGKTDANVTLLFSWAVSTYKLAISPRKILKYSLNLIFICFMQNSVGGKSELSGYHSNSEMM